jgi:hypothetical protein
MLKNMGLQFNGGISTMAMNSNTMLTAYRDPAGAETSRL